MESWGWERRGNEAEGETNETDRARRRERGKWRNGERKGDRARKRERGGEDGRRKREKESHQATSPVLVRRSSVRFLASKR